MALRPRTVLNNVGMEFAQFTTGLAVDKVTPSLTGSQDLKDAKAIRLVNSDGATTASGDEDFGLTVSEDGLFTKRTVVRAEAPELRLQQVPEAQHGQGRDYDVAASGGTQLVLSGGEAATDTLRCRFVLPATTAVGLGPPEARLALGTDGSADLAASHLRCGGTVEADAGALASSLRQRTADGNTVLTLGRGSGRLRLDSGALALREEAGTLVDELDADQGPSAAVSVAVTEALPGLNVGAFAILGEGEAVRVTASTLIDGLYALTVLRAQLGTDAARHDAGALLRVVESVASPAASLFEGSAAGSVFTVHGELRADQLASDVSLSAPQVTTGEVAATGGGTLALTASEVAASGLVSAPSASLDAVDSQTVTAQVFQGGTVRADTLQSADGATSLSVGAGGLSVPTLSADLVRPRDGSNTLTVGGAGTIVVADRIDPSAASMQIGKPAAESGVVTTIQMNDNVAVSQTLSADLLKVREIEPLNPGQTVTLDFELGMAAIATNQIKPSSGNEIAVGDASTTLVLKNDARLSGTLHVDRIVPSSKLSVGTVDDTASVLRVKAIESPDGALSLAGLVSIESLAISGVQTPLSVPELALGRAESGYSVRAQGDFLVVTSQLRVPEVVPTGVELGIGDVNALTTLRGSGIALRGPTVLHGPLSAADEAGLVLSSALAGTQAEFDVVRTAQLLPKSGTNALAVGGSRTDDEVELKAAVYVDTIRHFTESNAEKAINIGMVDSRINLSNNVHVAGTLHAAQAVRAPELGSADPFLRVTSAGGLDADAVRVNKVLTGSAENVIQLGNDAGTETRVSGTLAVTNIVHDSVATPYDLNITIGTEGTKNVKIGTFPSTTVEIFKELVVHGPALVNGVISTDDTGRLETPTVKISTIEPLDQSGTDPMVIFQRGDVAMESLRVNRVVPFSGNNVSVDGTIRTAAVFHPLESADNVLQVGNADTNLRLLSDAGVTVGPSLTTAAADVATLTVSTITSNTAPIQIASTISLPQINTETIRPLPEADPPVISVGKSGAQITLRDDVRVTGDQSVEGKLQVDNLAARSGDTVTLDPSHRLLATTVGLNSLLPKNADASDVIVVGGGATAVQVSGTLEAGGLVEAEEGLVITQGKNFSVSSAAVELSDTAAEIQLKKDTKVFGDLTITGDLITDVTSTFSMANIEASNTLYATRIDAPNEDDEVHIKKPVTITGGLNVTEYIRAPNVYGNLQNFTGGNSPVYFGPLDVPACPPEGPLAYYDEAGVRRTVDNSGVALPELRRPWGAVAALGTHAEPVGYRPSDDEFVFGWGAQHVVPSFGMVTGVEVLADSAGGALVGQAARVAFFKNGHPVSVGFQSMRRHPTQPKLVGPYNSGATYQYEDSLNADGTSNYSEISVAHAEPWMTLYWEPVTKAQTLPSRAVATSPGGTTVTFTLTPQGAVDLAIAGAEGVFFSGWHYAVDGAVEDVPGGAPTGTPAPQGSGTARLTVAASPDQRSVQVALVSGQTVLQDHVVTVPFTFAQVDTGACRLSAKVGHETPSSGLFQHKNILLQRDLLTMVVHNLAEGAEVRARGCFFLGQLGVTNTSAPGGADGHYTITDFIYNEPYVEQDPYAVDTSSY